ncbi:MAG TPA: RNA polymerase sigma-70 factor [Mariniphaga anaerophila]|uniref:RNA polymerase sigma-70 factor n=1 Tax=Mariniphaga anaerophila TaxID=1484053 RepID=A0A831LZ61_9BACT|nr:RNA polymerase sigma-70 factor [Mariniphaga anaerophila]
MLLNKRSIQLISLGDQNTFSHLMNCISDDLFLFACSFLQQKEIAEEIVSDVFVKTWENRKELPEIENLKAYLFVSVKNACITHIRKSRKEKLVSLDGMEYYKVPKVESAESQYISNETLSQIHKAIDTLPPKCKMAFSLAKMNGLSYREIAEIMEVSEKTVNNHLVLAVKKLSEILKISKKQEKKKSPLNQAGLFTL